MYVRNWPDVIVALWGQPFRSVLRIRKGILPHPCTFGMNEGVGFPEGQINDYRKLLEGGHGLHVKEFESHYEAHIDEVHPDVSVIEHLRKDAPGTFVSGSVAIGAAIGGVFGKSRDAALSGAAIGGLLGLLLTALDD